MTDIALHIIPTKPGLPPTFDIGVAGADLTAEHGLRTAVILSLFLNRRAADDDEVEGSDRGGSWMDQYLPIPPGSRLWLLAREKETPQTAERARRYAEEALAWLIDRRIARSVIVEAQWVRPSVLGLRIEITLAAGERWSELFDYSLAA